MRKNTYMDRLKSIGKKVNFAAVFTDLTRKGALSEKSFINKAEITIKKALKEIHKRGVIYTLCQSSMQSIECNKENLSILNHIFGIKHNS